MQINDQGTFYVEGEYKAGDIILTAGDWELKADVDGYKKYAFGYEPEDFPELVTNGTFDTDVSGWTAPYMSSISMEAGALRVTATGTNPYAQQLIYNLLIGERYVVSIDTISVSSGTWYLYLGSVAGLNKMDYLTLSITTPARYPFDFVSTTDTLNIQIVGGTTVGGFADFDNISVRLAHPKAGDTIQLGNGHHKDFRYYPYKLSSADIQELTR